MFPVLRSLIDRAKRKGRRTGQFLLLGSASIELLRQSSESLVGRLARVELTGLTVTEVGDGFARDTGADHTWAMTCASGNRALGATAYLSSGER